MADKNIERKQTGIWIDKRTQSKSCKENESLKSNNSLKINQSNLLIDMSNETIGFCEALSVDSKRFNEIDFCNKLNDYVNGGKRLLYSDISNYIFGIGDEKLKIFEVNLQKALDHSFEVTGSKDMSNAYIPIIKLWDHCNLAKRQLAQLRQSDEEFTEQFNCNVAPFKQEFTKEMNAQLISLIGLFTAMSFLVFGGINSLDNIFAGAKDIKILKIMIIGTIWGLCIQNLVFVFMFFVSKLTKLSIRSNESSNANFIQKYPLMCWSNLVLIFILVGCSWLFYIDHANIGGWFLKISSNNQELITITGFVVLIVITGIVAGLFLKLMKPKKEE